MRIIISDRIYLQKSKFSTMQLQQLRNAFTFKHPKNIEIELRAYCENTNIMAFSRGCYAKLMTLLQMQGHTFELTNKTIERKYVRELQGDIVLRPDQQSAIDALVQSPFGGIIVGSTSFGKTVIGACLSAQLKMVATTIVWSKLHQQQWLDEILKFNIFKKSEIGGAGGIFPGVEYKKINIVMQQFLHSNSDTFKQYNAITSIWIADEYQKYGAETFFDTMDRTLGRYRVGLTASIDRHDGLGIMLPYIVGNVVYKNISVDSPSRIPCKINIVTTSFFSCLFAMGGLSNQVSALTSMLRDKDRNRLIINRIMRHVKDNRLTLVYTSRKEHIMLLIRLLPPEIRYRCIMAGTPDASKYKELTPAERKYLEEYDDEKEFKEIQILAQNKEIDLIFGTQKVFVGASLKTIEAGIISIPVCHNEELFNQMVGRIERNYYKDDFLLKKYGQKRTPILDYLGDIEIPTIKERIVDMKNNYPRKIQYINGQI